jgi:hypothetical protein
MLHPVHKVTGFKLVGPYRIRVVVADGLVCTTTFRPVLEGECYGPLRDLDQFNSVSLDREAHTLVWPNGFDLATLHDWPEHEAAMGALAGCWAATQEKAR